LDLIEMYPELAKFTVFENGVLKLTEEGKN
jgi:hypothetical protein